jgi:hypothetical protein
MNNILQNKLIKHNPFLPSEFKIPQEYNSFKLPVEQEIKNTIKRQISSQIKKHFKKWPNDFLFNSNISNEQYENQKNPFLRNPQPTITDVYYPNISHNREEFKNFVKERRNRQRVTTDRDITPFRVYYQH